MKPRHDAGRATHRGVGGAVRAQAGTGWVSCTTHACPWASVRRWRDSNAPAALWCLPLLPVPQVMYACRCSWLTPGLIARGVGLITSPCLNLVESQARKSIDSAPPLPHEMNLGIRNCQCANHVTLINLYRSCSNAERAYLYFFLFLMCSECGLIYPHVFYPASGFLPDGM